MSQESPHLFPVYAQLPVRIVSGKGVVLHTDDGRELLDFYGGHAVAGLGYRHPAIQRTLESVAARLFFQTNAVPSTERAEAAAALADFAPDGLDRVFFVNSGAEANENALRLAFTARPGRDTVVSVTGGFHGRTAGAAAVTDGSAKWYGFPARPFSVRTVSRGDPEALAAAVDDRTAAVILEPVLGMAGAVPLSDRFLRAARAACDRTGALLVFDEVQCGMGRSGRPLRLRVGRRGPRPADHRQGARRRVSRRSAARRREPVRRSSGGGRWEPPSEAARWPARSFPR